MRNVFRMLAEDHRTIETLVGDLQLSPSEANFDFEGRRHILDRLVVAVSRHEATEELAFWPAVRRRVADGAALAETALGQERDAKFVLDAMRFLSNEAALVEQAREMAEIIHSHVAFEENHVWPVMRKATGWLGAMFLGLRFDLAGRSAPTRPHPHGPDTPLALATKGAAVAMVDRLRDRVSGRPGRRVDLSATGSFPDPVSVLMDDHREIESLLRGLEGAGSPDTRHIGRLVRVVSIHDSVEREHLYPLLRRRLPNGNDRYASWVVEHGEVAADLAELDRHPGEDRYRREVLDRVIPSLRAHMTREEDEVLPQMRGRLSDQELSELGCTLEAAKSKAPTRPHPHAAGAGSGAKLSRLLLSPVDRVRDRSSSR